MAGDPGLTLSSLRPGDHVCGLFDGPGPRDRVVARYLHEGLLRGEKVVHVADPAVAKPVPDLVRAAGADVPALLARGQLEVLAPADVYHNLGPFEPGAMLATLDAKEAQATEEGYPALRITADMSWALQEESLTPLLEYEALLNRRYPGSRALGLCQYDAGRFPVAAQLGLLATHPLALINDELVENFYYMPPEDFLGPRRDAAMLERWRANLLRSRIAEEERRKAAQAELQREHERALEMFKSRFIRRAGDEIRRPLQPLLQHLAHLGDDAQMQPDPRERARAALAEARRLERVTEDILAIVAADAGELRLKPGTVDLAALAQEAVQEARPEGVDVRVVGGRTMAWGDIGHLRQVVSDVLRVALDRTQPGGQVRLLCGTLGSSQARLLVMHDGQDVDGADLFVPWGKPGLFLARSIVEIHGGRIHTAGGDAIEVVLPARPP